MAVSTRKRRGTATRVGNSKITRFARGKGALSPSADVHTSDTCAEHRAKVCNEHSCASTFCSSRLCCSHHSVSGATNRAPISTLLQFSRKSRACMRNLYYKKRAGSSLFVACRFSSCFYFLYSFETTRSKRHSSPVFTESVPRLSFSSVLFVLPSPDFFIFLYLFFFISLKRLDRCDTTLHSNVN